MSRRTVAGSLTNDFARQLAERNAELHPSNVKKFRASAAPKGTRLGPGYQDRTQSRTSGDEDDKAVRVKALEDMVRLGQMDKATFEALRDEIVGGNVHDVHLVKGLDYKLLERVRKGEDVLSDKGQPTVSENRSLDEGSNKSKADVDEEFEKLEEKDIKPVKREGKVKKGEMAPPPPILGKKRTRDDILQELKASRAAAAEKAKQSALGPKFMKVGGKRQISRIETDERGREVLITTDADGKVKRKVKKASLDSATNCHGLLMPNKNATPLGMEVAPIIPPPLEEEEEEEEDIFEGVGTDYNPLGDEAVDDDDSDSSNDEPRAAAEALASKASPPLRRSEFQISEAASPSSPPRKKHNWLGDAKEGENAESGPLQIQNPLSDPTILTALKKASTLNPLAQEVSNEEEAAKLARRKKMLESQDRDAEDMDMEFGSNRFGDQEDGEDTRVKLSVWGGEEKDEEDKGKGQGGRKRGRKKRKGDGNSAADVLMVMERRKNEGQ